MGCRTSTFRVTMPVFSDGTDTTTGIFIPFKRVMVEQWVRARLSLIMNGTSCNLTVKTAAMYGDVDADFASGTIDDMPSTPISRTTDGQTWGDGYTTLDTSQQMVEFGVRAYNVSTYTTREMAQVTLIIELQE